MAEQRSEKVLGKMLVALIVGVICFIALFLAAVFGFAEALLKVIW